MKKAAIITALSLLLSFGVKGAENSNSEGSEAPKFAYKVEFGSLFDNLESSKAFEQTRTLFGAKLRPEVGFTFGKNSSVMGGFDLIQEFGSAQSSFPTQIDYTLYFRYKSDKYGAYAGSFGRDNSLAEFPLSFFREDIYFYDRNIEGLMLQFENRKKNGFVELFVDWYGINHDENIDRFLIVASTKYSFCNKLVGVGANLLLNHVLDTPYLEDAYLLERGQYNFFVESELSSLLPSLTHFRVQFAALGSLEHKRQHSISSDWNASKGYSANLLVEYKGFGLDNRCYFGKGQFDYYSMYGKEFYPGSAFFTADKYYNRSAFYYCYSTKYLSLSTQFILHATTEGVANQQMITLGVKIGNVKE